MRSNLPVINVGRIPYRVFDEGDGVFCAAAQVTNLEAWKRCGGVVGEPLILAYDGSTRKAAVDALVAGLRQSGLTGTLTLEGAL